MKTSNNTSVLPWRRSKSGHIYSLQALRIILFCILIIYIDTIVTLNTSTLLLAAAATAGVLFAGRWAFAERSLLRISLWHLAILFLLSILVSGTGAIVRTAFSEYRSADFAVFMFGEHMWLAVYAYLFAACLTWMYWRSAAVVTLELLLFAALLIGLFSGHWDFNFEAPRAISDFAWEHGIQMETVLIGTGIGASLVFGLYMLLSLRRPRIGAPPVIEKRQPLGSIAVVCVSAGLCLVFWFWSTTLAQRFAATGSEISNGVGSEGQEGQSPLGFHSAIGKTKQPSALLRLESGYRENPWSPMMYLREGALSQFSGHELVIAGPKYDTDVPRIGLGQRFSAPRKESGPFRVPVTQSVYLLTEHASPFALDFPVKVSTLGNPDPKRFLAAYQAESFAPTAPIKELLEQPVGNPSWPAEILAHYLRAPGSLSDSDVETHQWNAPKPIEDAFGEDLRYKALAQKLTNGVNNPLNRVLRIINELSQTSTYTRAPGHQITRGGDPVAPYLFSTERRGYCVHFSHAAVYLLRLAGIPARIATGYMTNTQYAKDGHILLHLGDRHAWPEVYIYGHGWVVADIAPANAENEQEIVPDEKLLEELMNKIDPAAIPLDSLDEAIANPNTSLNSLSVDRRVLLRIIVGMGLLLCLLAAISKAWLRCGYLLTNDPVRRLLRADRSAATLAADLAVVRSLGETANEHAHRVRNQLSLDISGLRRLRERQQFGRNAESVNSDAVSTAVEDYRRNVETSISRWARLRAFCSTRSFERFNRW